MMKDRSQLYSFDSKRGIKTVKTRIGDNFFTKLTTYKDGKRKLDIYKFDEILYSMEV